MSQASVAPWADDESDPKRATSPAKRGKRSRKSTSTQQKTNNTLKPSNLDFYGKKNSSTCSSMRSSSVNPQSDKYEPALHPFSPIHFNHFPLLIMYALILAVPVPLFAIAYFLNVIINHYRDPKGFRKFPGFNALTPFTDLAWMAVAETGFRSQSLYEAHSKLGPVLRIGPNALSFSDPAAIKDIYGFSSKCSKDDFYQVLSAHPHYHLADVIDRAEHSRKRKVLSSAYALKNVETWEFKVEDKTRRFVKACDAACTAPLKENLTKIPENELTFDYRSWSNFFTQDAIADIGLSEQLGFLDQGHSRCTAERLDGTLFEADYRECLHATQLVQSRLVWQYKWYKPLEKLTKILPTRISQLWRLNEGWNGIVRHRVSKRIARHHAGEDVDDFVTALLQDRKTGSPHNLPVEEIEQEISIMMNAGSDTTAIALTNVMYHLLRNPACLAKLRAELDNVLSDEDSIVPYSKVKRLPYLKACLDESLRLTAPTVFGLPRKTPPEGQYINGNFIAGNTSVSVSPWVSHRDENIFPRPEEYIPERWLDEEAANLGFPEAKSLQSFFIAFSAGPRGCIGKNISYLEQSVLLSTVVRRYEMRLPSPDWTIDRWENMNLMPGAMPLKVWRREGSKDVVFAEDAEKVEAPSARGDMGMPRFVAFKKLGDVHPACAA